jgi:predicted transcriptional regulator
MKNLQISIEDTMVSYLDRLAEHQQKTRTALIREAIAYWIRYKNIEQFESQWISALKSDTRGFPEDDEAWLAAEAWDEQ